MTANNTPMHPDAKRAQSVRDILDAHDHLVHTFANAHLDDDHMGDYESSVIDYDSARERIDDAIDAHPIDDATEPYANAIANARDDLYTTCDASPDLATYVRALNALTLAYVNYMVRA